MGIGAVRETIRGSGAIALWLASAPFVALRVALAARSKTEARRLVIRHSARALKICRINTEVSGDLPQPEQGCVVCYNETSLVDVVVVMSALLPHVDRAAGADVYARIPLARRACRKADIEMVPRGDRAATERLLGEMVEAVGRGERLAWGGEGHLSGCDEVTHFKVGAGLIAIRAGVPLIPVAIHGGHQAMPLGSFRARPGTIRLRFGEPIYPDGFGEADARLFADKVRDRVAALYAELGNERAGGNAR